MAHKDIVTSLQQNLEEALAFYKTIPEEKWLFSYADGKWTIKEVVQHLLDTERVFAYRALCFSRKDNVELPGFDQDDYLINSNANSRSKESLIEEYISIRKATIHCLIIFRTKCLYKLELLVIIHYQLGRQVILLLVMKSITTMLLKNGIYSLVMIYNNQKPQ